jgi:phosphohistidine phosphatase SixA
MHRLFRRAHSLWPAVLALAVLFGLAATPHAYADDAALWTLMKKPGHIAFLRHAHSPESPPDGDVKSNDCTTQRNLDDAGRAQARRLADAFRKHGIASAQIYSSRYCRAMETDKLIKLGAVRPLPALDQAFLADLGGMAETRTKTRAFIKSNPPKRLTILVSHVSNIQSIAGVSLDSGELAVGHVEPSGELAVNGRIKIP